MEQKTILLAEDNPEHAELIRRAFERMGSGYRLVVVANGAEVIDYLFATGSHADRGASQMPSLMLLDLKMPELGGLQVLQVLRRVRGDAAGQLPPVVILTASQEESDLIDAYRLGAHSYIQKPAEFSQLVDAIRRIVDYWLGLNRMPPPRRSNPGPAGNHRSLAFYMPRPVSAAPPGRPDR